MFSIVSQDLIAILAFAAVEFHGKGRHLLQHPSAIPLIDQLAGASRDVVIFPMIDPF